MLAMFVVCISTALLSARPAAAQTGPKAVAMWSMAPRLEQSWASYIEATGAYKDTLFTQPLKVDVDGCASTLTAPGSFRWTVTDFQGKSVASTANGCKGSFIAPREGSYNIKLQVLQSGVSASTTIRADVRHHVVLVMGDSLPAGEGNPDVPNRYVGNQLTEAEKWVDQSCHRSKKSAPALFAQALEHDTPGPVTLINIACSGAKTYSGVVGPYAGQEPRPAPLEAQIDQAIKMLCGTQTLAEPCRANAPQVKTIVMSVGVNNLNFSSIIKDCATPDPGGTPCNERLAGEVYAALAALPLQFDVVANRLQGPLGSAKVLLMEYPDDPFNRSDACGWMDVVGGGINEAEAEWINDVAVGLNAKLASIAARYNWVVIGGVAQGFDQGHDYCSDDSWYVRRSEAMFNQGDESGTLHPNAAGHAFIAERIVAAYKAPWAPRLYQATATINVESVKLTAPNAAINNIAGAADVMGKLWARVEGITGTQGMDFEESFYFAQNSNPFPNGSKTPVSLSVPVNLTTTNDYCVTLELRQLRNADGGGVIAAAVPENEDGTLGPPLYDNLAPETGGIPGASFHRCYSKSELFGTGRHTVRAEGQGDTWAEITYTISVKWNPLYGIPSGPEGGATVVR